MPTDIELGLDLQNFVDGLVESGRYSSHEDVLREGVRLMHERESALAALDHTLAAGIADADAGRVKPLDEVFDRLEAKCREAIAAER